MGRTKEEAAKLGKSIIRSRFTKTRRHPNTFLHTTELPDGYEWGRLDLKSVTEQSDLAEFLSTAEMAGTEFIAEKMNVMVIDPSVESGLPDAEALRERERSHETHRERLCIPRRPQWNESTSAEQLAQLERENFLEWRRDLALLQEETGLIITPYEKNLEFWRQLWRVIERSDVIVQIVDARNPLLFFSRDLEKYVREVDSSKLTLILINKADYLTPNQRQYWLDYFTTRGLCAVFWSALDEARRQLPPTDENDEEESSDGSSDESTDEGNESENDEIDEIEDIRINCEQNERINENNRGPDIETENMNEHENQADNSTENFAATSQNSNTSNEKSKNSNLLENSDGTTDKNQLEDSNKRIKNQDKLTNNEFNINIVSENVGDIGIQSDNEQKILDNFEPSSNLLTVQGLLDVLRRLCVGRCGGEATTVGMVGYPNVGKSSTINTILQTKKVPVSATPGRTKHFQTLYVDDDLILCDCPGLVFPSFVSTKAELIVNGILPIDQMREHLPPVALICERIPRDLLSRVYGIMLPVPSDLEDPNRAPTAYEFLASYALMRGYMTQKGLPDTPRSARHILKDYVNGKLIYSHPPPSIDASAFEPTVACLKNIGTKLMNKPVNIAKGTLETPSSHVQKNVDQDFFHERTHRAHVVGATGQRVGILKPQRSGKQQVSDKPWKQKVKLTHKKREKLRRVYRHLDEHSQFV